LKRKGRRSSHQLRGHRLTAVLKRVPDDERCLMDARGSGGGGGSGSGGKAGGMIPGNEAKLPSPPTAS